MNMGGRETAERSYAPITPEHLRLLSRLAGEEREAFFERNPTQIPLYRDRFIAAALCQGAALHYLGKGDGVKDFDIHLFYVQRPDRGQMARTVRSIREEVPGFGPRKIDFIRTVVPGRLIQGPSGDRVGTLRRFLEVRPTKNARHLAEKAVIGLIPEAILGMVVWPGPYGVIRILPDRGPLRRVRACLRGSKTDPAGLILNLRFKTGGQWARSDLNRNRFGSTPQGYKQVENGPLIYCFGPRVSGVGLVHVHLQTWFMPKAGNAVCSGGAWREDE